MTNDAAEGRIVMDPFRWAVVLAAVLLVVGLMAYARGTDHHRGDEIGTHGTKIVVIRTDNG